MRVDQGFTCRACSGNRGQVVLDLGVQPLANNLPLPEQLGEPEPRFPLRIFVCPDCWLLQITDTVPPLKLFSEYLYFSSFSETMLAHARSAAERYAREFNLGPRSLVCEIASNDGYLLQNFVRLGIPSYGIEPAANVARAAEAKGISTVIGFFDAGLARQLASAGRQSDLILGNNVLAHVPEINDFVAGLKTLLSPRGRIVIEFPYALELIAGNEFDTIYHEHVFYFALTPLVALFRRHGLEIVHVEKLQIHGGSLRVFAVHSESAPIAPSVSELMETEKQRGVTDLRAYDGFRAQVEATKQQLVELLRSLKAQGKRIAAYGASAKGSTLLNYCGLRSETLEFVADRSTHKQGRVTPGTHLPIVPAEELSKRMPDYTVLLTWNFADEILAQQKDYRKRGGKFIIPIPRPRIVS